VGVSKAFRRFSVLTLVFIYLVIIAGSIVRTTGSGMGCPDWPKCFGSFLPPTCGCQLPEDYQKIYLNYRVEKIEKFCDILDFFGLSDLSQQIRSDQSLFVDEEFSVAKAWTEYGNRLVGFIAGNLVLLLFLWTVISYRRNRTLLFLTFLNLVLMALEGWFGSIVVASNLVPWTITVHMFLALVIIGIQIKIVRIARGTSDNVVVKSAFLWLFYSCLMLTFIQIILGAQVRQEVDFFVRDEVNRSLWISSMPGDFLYHRSFSWILLLAHLALWLMCRKAGLGLRAISWMLGIIGVEFLTGILFSYAGMPALLQPLHLLLASILLGLQFFTLGRLKKTTHYIAV